MLQMTEPDLPPSAGPSLLDRNNDELPSYAAQSTDTPPPPPAYRSHRRLVLWPAPFPSSPDPLFGVDVTSSLPSTDEFGAEEIRAIGPACVCDECAVHLVDDKKDKGARVHGRIAFQGLGGVVWVWDAREASELHRWPRQGTGPVGGIWRLSPSHEMVGLFPTPEGLCERHGECSTTVDIDASTVALGDGGGVRVALGRGTVAFWRDGEPAYLHAPPKLPLPIVEDEGWARWRSPTPSFGGDLVTDGIRVAAGEVAVALRRNGEVWVAAESWYLLCIVTEPEAVDLAAAGPLVALYRTSTPTSSSESANPTAAYVVHTLRRQVHPVRVGDGIVELALRPLSIPPPTRKMSTSGSEKKLSFGDTRRRLSLVLGGKDESLSGPRPGSSASALKHKASVASPASERETSLSLADPVVAGKSDKGKEEEGKVQERKLSFSALRRASISTISTGPSSKGAGPSGRPALSLEGYEASLRTASGDVFAWNLRWPILAPHPSDRTTGSGSDTEEEEDDGMIELPTMNVQAVRLPPGERDSTLFPISVGVRSALCVTVGESDEPGFKEKVRRAWKGKGRVPLMGPMGPYGAYGL